MDHFDIAIIGGGLSGLIKAEELLQNSDKNLKIVVIDPYPESLKDKTFSYWIKKSDLPHAYSKLVSHSWQQIRITNSNGSVFEASLADYRYERIPGETLLAHLNSKLNKNQGFFQIRGRVVKINELQASRREKPLAILKIEPTQEITASQVFSSPLKPATSVLQSFVGFEIETPTDCFDTSVVDLMDFRVPQQDEVRFVYTLPFLPTRALVEFTVFSEEMLDPEKSEGFLKDYLTNTLAISSYRIIKKESGVIPMSTDSEPLFAPAFNNSVIQTIGGAAGLIKPSTGYSFRRNLDQRKQNFKYNYADIRFRIYDSIMLDIIRSSGGRVGDIFWGLFRNNKIISVFEFLDERSSPIREIAIFSKMPLFLFASRLVRLYPFFFAVLLTFVLNFTVGGIAVWIIPILGFLSYGIGHGSLDHLLGSRFGRNLHFWSRYLGSIIAFFFCWYFLPELALCFFILQSAKHFGESQWVRPIRRANGSFKINLLAWIWGLFAAVFGVLFHWSESTPIIQGILNTNHYIDSLSTQTSRLVGLLLFFLAAGASWILDLYELKSTGRKGQGLPSTLFLGLSLSALPLLPGFFCFFAFWHAYDSVKDQKIITGWDSITYLKKAAPFTVITIFAILALVITFAKFTNQPEIWKFVFLMIGALTAAHTPVMTKFLFEERR